MNAHDERALNERRAKALELHLAGLSYSQIAQQLDTSKSRAHDYVKAALLSRVEAAPAGLPADAAMTELARLDAMLSGLWPKARRGDVAAVDRVLKIEERRSHLVARANLPAAPAHQGEDAAQPAEGVPRVADIATARARRLADAEGPASP